MVNYRTVFLVVLLLGTLIGGLFLGGFIPDVADSSNQTDDPENNNSNEGAQYLLQEEYNNTISSSFTITKTLDSTYDNRTTVYEDKFFYNPNSSFYSHHVVRENEETVREYEEYYLPDEGYEKRNKQADPSQTNQTLSEISVTERIGLKQFLQLEPDSWKESGNTYTLQTSLQNSPIRQEQGYMEVTIDVSNSKIESVTVLLDPTESSPYYGNESTLTFDISEYQEPDFYWKEQV